MSLWDSGGLLMEAEVLESQVDGVDVASIS